LEHLRETRFIVPKITSIVTPRFVKPPETWWNCEHDVPKMLEFAPAGQSYKNQRSQIATEPTEAAEICAQRDRRLIAHR
jgi:hypothetical protein